MIEDDPEIELPLLAYCDGSGTHRPGDPACIGVVIADAEGRILCESSAHVREGTSNVAEVLAIRRALWLISRVGPMRHATPAIVFSDSVYAIGLVRGEWGNFPSSKNNDLVGPMRRQYARHRGQALLQHVRGHDGIPGNELADWLAWTARRMRRIALGEIHENSPRRRRPVLDHALLLAPRPPPAPRKKSEKKGPRKKPAGAVSSKR